jgi:hypothetical protein
MTVAELRYVLKDMNDDAEVVVADGDNAYRFGPEAVNPGTIRGKPVVVIDLTSTDCEVCG